MEFLSTHTALTDALHALSQALLAPDIILLLAFACYAVFCIGSVIAEYFTERRNFRIAMPKFLAALMAAKEEDIPQVVAESGLLNRQKIALLTVYDYRTLPGDSMVALIRRVVNQEETRYDRITGRNNTAAKISPMLGLMGTLIPLGPGIAALGQADTSALSSSLLVAFDTTVAGLIVAAVCLAVGKIRSNWYNDYLSALDSGMATMLQKIENMREEGTITAQEPTDYAFLFEQSIAQEKGKAKNAEAAAQIAEDVTAEAGIAKADDKPAKTVQEVVVPAAEREAEAGTSVEAPIADAPKTEVPIADAPAIKVPEIVPEPAAKPVESKAVSTAPIAGGSADAPAKHASEPAGGMSMAARLKTRRIELADGKSE